MTLHITDGVSRLLTLLTLLLCLSSCGGDGEIRIDGRIDGMGTSNLRLVYYSADAVQTTNANAIDGKFMMTGRVSQPTLVRVYANNGAIVGRLAIEPGETVNVTFNLKEPWHMEADGNDDSEYLASFLKENADLIKNADRKGLNAAIDTYVRRYPKRGVSGILMTDFFSFAGNESQGAELLGLLQKAPRVLASTPTVELLNSGLAIPADSMRLNTLTLFSTSDSLRQIDPSKGGRNTLIMITDSDSRNADSITAAVSKLKGRYRASSPMRILDIGVDKDTVAWHRSLASTGDAGVKGTEHFWALSPRHIKGLEEVTVGTVPWFILADSTGQVIHSAPTLPK